MPWRPTVRHTVPERRKGDRPARTSYSLLQRAFSVAARRVRPSLDARRGRPHPRGTAPSHRFAIHLLPPKSGILGPAGPLENSLEIEEIFRSAGFAVVDPASMTLNQQKAIFQNAEIIAGINGAAFTNALFRHNKPLTIGALISSNWMSTTCSDDGESLRLRLHRLCCRARGGWHSQLDHGAAGHSQQAHRPSNGWFVNFSSVNDV